MTDWLDDFIEQHKELESPLSFWKWSALAAVSAVVRDNVWMDRYLYKMYPNIYVMLHADSGLKKGPPVSAAKQLVQLTGKQFKIITGRASIQGILKELQSSSSTVQGQSGLVHTKSVAFICSSELSASIVEDPVASKILTDLYDRQYNVGEWKSLLKMETFNLKDPTITMLTATNEAMGEAFFNKSEIQGGFIARTFVIYESKRNKINSLSYPLKNPPNYIRSAEYLKILAKLQGPFEPFSAEEKSEIHHIPIEKEDRLVFFSDVGYLYDQWYINFQNQIDTQEVKDETGTLNRFGDSVLKVAMLLSLSHSPELRITCQSMNEAIGLCEKLVGNIRKTTLGKKGISQSSQIKAMIINELLTRENHAISREMLMKKMWMHYSDEDEFNNLMISFESAGLIKARHTGNVLVFYMPDEQVKQFKAFMAGKMEQQGEKK